MSMAAGSSKGVSQKQTSGSGGKSGKLGAGSSKIEASASRTKNTSGGDSLSGPGGGRTIIICDGKNVTPKSLVPSQFQKNAGADGVSPDAAAAGPSAAPVKGEDEKPLEERAAPQVPERIKPQKAATLSQEELNRNVDIVLGETETETLLVFPSLLISLDNPLHQTVSARNKAYEELCASKADSDQYKEQHAQTLNQPHKSKEVFAASPSQEHAEVNANGWDIHDTFASLPVPKHEQIQQACEKESQATVSLAVKKPGCLFTMQEPYPSSETTKEAKKSGDKDKKGAKSMGLSGTLRAGMSGPSTMGAGGSRTLGSGPTGDSLGQAGGSPAPAAVDSAGAGAAPAIAGEAGPGSPKPEGAEDGEAAAEEAPGENIPWKVGAENPIPEEMAKSLRTMERIVSQNVFHRQHMIYRNYPTLEELAKLDEQRLEEAMAGGVAGLAAAADASAAAAASEPNPSATLSSPPAGAGLIEGEGDLTRGEDEDGDELAEEVSRDEGKSDKPSLEDLFCFEAPSLTQGMTVTCAEWNSNNKDLLAVSYGDTAPVPSNPGGLVLFWSLKNPTYPERVIRTRHGVTALHFSSCYPNMVAAGTHDGSVMIWDLRRPSDQPMLRSGSSVSQHNDQKHTDIVWETKWVDQGPDKQPPELLVSVSSDGNVFQWSLKKGLEQMLLMQLKRIANPYLGANCVYKHKEGIVFRKSSGFCVDFPRQTARGEPSTYLVGTEDGLVHRCSTSYNEQYLDTYYGHSGPVYRVRCNPFMSHAFLTCSADWTMKLWTTKPPAGHPPETPLLTFQSTDLFDAVNDVIWAPQNSTSFAAAMDDGRIELWDLSEKPLDPIVVHYPQANMPQRRRTCVRFSPNSPVLVAGDDQGSVDVMRMYNTNQSYYSDQEQQDRLAAVMVKKR